MNGLPNADFWQGTRVCVTGGHGFLGKPTVRMLEELGAAVSVPRSAEFDLRDRGAATEALRGSDVVIHLAAKVGGIGYNLRNPVALSHDNTLMGVNVFEASLELGVEKLVAVCSVCAYPKHTPVPFKETDIWNGYPEGSNAPYGVAKRLLITLSDAYRREHGLDSCVPVLANLYGPEDNFDLEDSHVIAAMVHKFVVATQADRPQVTLWGTGSPSREFLYVDDAARALLLAAERYDNSDPFNVGTGIETRIRDLAETISTLTGFEGDIVWDSSRPDGQPTRYLDISMARDRLGFESAVPLEEGLRRTVESFREGLHAGAVA